MFLARRPSLDASIGSSAILVSCRCHTVRSESSGRRRLASDVDELAVAIGNGVADFERARAALVAWKQFDIGWVETFPRHGARHRRNHCRGSDPALRLLVAERLPSAVLRRRRPMPPDSAMHMARCRTMRSPAKSCSRCSSIRRRMTSSTAFERRRGRKPRWPGSVSRSSAHCRPASAQTPLRQ